MARTHTTISAFESGDSAASKRAHDGIVPEWEEDGHPCGSSQLLENERLEAGLAGACLTLLVGSTLGSCGRLDAATTRKVLSVLGVAGGAAYGCRRWSFERWYRRHYAREHARETWELANYEKGEREEMAGLFTHKGMARRDAEAVVGTMSHYKEFFVNLMMTEELHLREPLANHGGRAATCGACFAVAALVPLFLADAIHALTTTLSVSFFSQRSDAESLRDPAADADRFHHRALLALGVATLGAVGARRAVMSLLALKTHALESVLLGLVCLCVPKLVFAIVLGGNNAC